jgi:hypothetical protein
MTAYPIGIVGESFANEDGSSRQAEIKRCSAGEPVSLERDPQNRYDAKCIKVVSVRGRQIGNMSRNDAWIADRIHCETFVDARILGIRKNANGMHGVVLCVRTAKDDEWLEDEQRSTSERSTGCSIVLFAVLLPFGALISAVR